MADLFVTVVVLPGTQALLLLLVAFIVTFLFSRFSMRTIRTGPASHVCCDEDTRRATPPIAGGGRPGMGGRDKSSG